MNLLNYARDEFSQNGDDGIIERIFAVISDGPGLCCEFGAWDGVHFSNTRALVLRGWRGVMIEADPSRFEELQKTYADNDRVVCIRSRVDDARNRLESLLEKAGMSDRLDFLSIDIDGLDFYAFRSLRASPLCVAVEVNAGHPPDVETLVARQVAARNVGQPLGAFVQVAEDRGYRLIAYNGNAYFLHEDAGGEAELPAMQPADTYMEFLAHSTSDAREWLYRVNLGLAPPYFRFRNPRLRRDALGIPRHRAVAASMRGGLQRAVARPGVPYA